MGSCWRVRGQSKGQEPAPLRHQALPECCFHIWGWGWCPGPPGDTELPSGVGTPELPALKWDGAPGPMPGLLYPGLLGLCPLWSLRPWPEGPVLPRSPPVPSQQTAQIPAAAGTASGLPAVPTQAVSPGGPSGPEAQPPRECSSGPLSPSQPHCPCRCGAHTGPAPPPPGLSKQQRHPPIDL